MADKTKNLILGLTGGIGRAVTLALIKRNLPVAALVRNKDKASKYIEGLPAVELIVGDAGNTDHVENAMKDVGTIYYCVNVPYNRWEQDALNLFEITLNAAVKHKCKLIFPGNVYVYGHAQYNPVNEEHPLAAHTKKGKIRIRMEEMLAEAAAKDGLDYTIVRMPDFYGPFVINGFSEKLYINALKGKAMQWIGDLDAEVELIFIEDGGEAMVMAAMQKQAEGQTYNIPGVSPTTARAYLQTIAKLAGSKSKIGTLNADILYTILGLFIPVIREVKEMLYLKREKLILDGSKFEKTIGKLPATDYNKGIQNTLDWVKDFYKIH